MALSDSQKGRIVEQLVGATLLLQSDGSLRVSLPLVDDEGVDLVVANRTNDKSLLLQVKSRFSLTGRGGYRTNVRRATCHPNPNKFMLFVFYDREAGKLGDVCWLIPAVDFCTLLKGQRTTRANFIFESRFHSQQDMWKPFKTELPSLARRISEILG